MAELFAMKTPSGQLDPLKIEYPLIVQPKLDGLRGIAIKSGSGNRGPVQWYSFTGKPLWNLEAVSDDLPREEGVYDGEIIWPGHPFSDAYGLCKRQTPKGDTAKLARELRFVIFDRLELSEWTMKQCHRTFMERMAPLTAFGICKTAPHGDPELFGQRGHCVFLGFGAVHNAVELERAYARYLNDGHEGLMAKNPDGLYRWTRHPDWHRYKPTVTHDVKVIAVYEEDDKNGDPKGTLGGCLIEIPAEDGFSKVTCKVGGGFKALERKKFWTPERATKSMTCYGVTMHDGSPLIGKTIEVESKCRNPSGALREPHFVRLREDK